LDGDAGMVERCELAQKIAQLRIEAKAD
jgi:hypothetical protein